MLLFQWGTRDWGKGEAFEYNLTRQLTPGDDDADIWQLRLTFRFAPSPERRALGAGNQWCHSPAELAGLRSFVRGSAAFAAVGQLGADKVLLEFGPT
jgi:hypothetical protein